MKYMKRQRYKNGDIELIINSRCINLWKKIERNMQKIIKWTCSKKLRYKMSRNKKIYI